MKKLLIGTAAALLLLGAGCASRIPILGGGDSVEGMWNLAFDLPEGWAMVRDYEAPRYSMVVPTEDVSRDHTDVIIQSTTKAIVTGGISPEATVDAATYVGEDYTLIHAYRLDQRRVVPSEAEDLGDGWYRLKLCEDGEDCMIYGQYNYEYYFIAGSGAKYKFSIITEGQDPARAIETIQTAKEVTNFTDSPRIDVESETK
ncbi:MAG: hypothetical protein NUV56_04810 [Candidatus Uhrbacteria bacterium]|nr:hypothetical protein [Candidatus Uhrbacteria bacterium]